jgi:excisionase family DNA binding protein
VLFIAFVGGTLLLVLSAFSSPRSKRLRKTVILTPLLAGLLITTFVQAADVRRDQSDEQHQLLTALQIMGVGLVVLGCCSLLSKMRFETLWLPNDAPFDTYKPFKPAYPSKFATAPILKPTHFQRNSITLADAARYLRISEHDVLQLIDEGSIIAFKRGNVYQITRRALDDFARQEKFGL